MSNSENQGNKYAWIAASILLLVTGIAVVRWNTPRTAVSPSEETAPTTQTTEETSAESKSAVTREDSTSAKVETPKPQENTDADLSPSGTTPAPSAPQPNEATTDSASSQGSTK